MLTIVKPNKKLDVSLQSNLIPVTGASKGLTRHSVDDKRNHCKDSRVKC